jgi:hypothetical protein
MRAYNETDADLKVILKDREYHGTIRIVRDMAERASTVQR